VSGDDALVVKVDRVLLGQAVMNLVINAAEAAGTEAAGDDQGMGWVSVRYARRDVARGGITAAGDLPASRPAAVGLRLVVCDSGGGISAEMADRIFNPFFTTKSTGCGLGLSVVHRIVEAHDGSVRVLQGEEALQEHAAARVEMLRQGWADVRQQASGAVFEILI
jgi:signal transduction histidine kinase